MYSSPATVYIDIVLDNDAPTISNFAGNDNSTTFVEQTAGNIVPAAAVVFDDTDSAQLNQAIIDISGNFVSGVDSLSCPSPAVAGISCTPFNSSTGELVLSGNASPASYVTALERVQFTNSSDNPDTNQRSISLTIRDDSNQPSATAVRTYTNSISRINDPPTLDDILDQSGTEGVLISIDVDTVLTDPDTSNNGTDISWSIDTAIVGDMAISNTGAFTWTPDLGVPPPPATFGATYPVTISADDGEFSDSVSFTLTIDPPDEDGDGVADYNDYCPGFTQPIGESYDVNNVDTDGDGTYGVDADPNDTVGGDVCDTDDDNDGMPDQFEIDNSLDPLNALDAAEDADGDGVSNLQEYIDGTNPNLGNLSIDATGYFTPYELTPPDPKSIHSAATAVTASDYGPYRPGDNTITWTPSNSLSGDLESDDPGGLVSNPPEQPFDIRPLASFGVNQQVEENSTVTVTVSLNGDAPSWTDTPAPNDAQVDYSVSGTATAADHDALAGSVTFSPGEYQKSFTFDVFADAVADANETVVFTITGATNAAIGSQSTHRVTIVESNIAPRGSLAFDQTSAPWSPLASAYTNFDGGVVNITLDWSDANAGQTLTYDWSGSHSSLVAPTDLATDTWPTAALADGNYLVDVLITDNGSPARSTRISRILKVGSTLPTLDPVDSDDDGTDDDVEGYGDADGDGIPDYLDAQDGGAGGGNLIPDQTVRLSNSHLLESTSGTTLTRGQSASAAGRFGALMTDDDIEQYGGRGGIAPLNAEDSFEHATGIYDFEVSGLLPGAQATIVIPLQTGIPKDAVYRKFDPATGWSNFVVDGNNRIASAVGARGACPEPGSVLYESGLHYLDNCIQLTIEDGGPNDSDNAANGVVVDPGTTGFLLSEPETEEVEKGAGRLSPLMLAVLLMLGLLAVGRRRRRVAVSSDR